MKKKILPLMFLAAVSFSSCKNDDDQDPLPTTDYSHGVLITNEGSFSSGTGTVSYYDRNLKAVTQDIFEHVNGFPLGNVVQSAAINAGKAYIVVNNAQKVDVVNLSDFKSLGEITSLSQPRYFLGVSSTKGYITQWGDGSLGELKVVDLNTNSISKTLDIGKGSDRMLLAGNYVFVCNAGGYNATFDPVNDSAISVIDIQGDSLFKRIEVGYNPGGIVEDVYGKIWVICYGINDFNVPANDRPGKLVRINPSTMAVELSLPFASNDLGMRLTINDNGYKIYFQYMFQTYQMGVSESTLPSSVFINRNFYAMSYDPGSRYIYGSDAGNFNSNGYVFRYRETGELVDSFMVGIGPGNFTFLPQ